MGPCCSIGGSTNSPRLFKARRIKIGVGSEQTQSQEFITRTKLHFSKKQAIVPQKDPNSLFAVSSITLHKPNLSQNISTKSSDISVYLQGSEILSDESSIIQTASKFLDKSNENSVELIQIYEPLDFDLLSRRILFKCVAHAITHFEQKVDLKNLRIRKIVFCWDKADLVKFSKWFADFINVDDILIEI